MLPRLVDRHAAPHGRLHAALELVVVEVGIALEPVAGEHVVAALDAHEASAVEIAYDADAPDREAESLRITARCTALLEQAIRARPEEWVWMHERWKTRPA